MSAANRLVFVSHRLPVSVGRTADGVRVTRAIGGLAAGLDRAMRERGGTWIAWMPGCNDASSPSLATVFSHPIRPVVLQRGEAKTFHAGFANQVLWPLCHMFPAHCRFHPALWTAYRRTNERFAAAVRAVAEAGNLVWVNDFHLGLVPGLLRATGPVGRLGAFWSIPFPPPAVFGICPRREEMLAGLLGADLVGFQTDADAENFLDCVRTFLGLGTDDGARCVRLPGREVRVVALAMGIDAVQLAKDASSPATRAQAAELRARLGGDTVMLGVDRLDYAKGVLERLLGYERFLDRHAEWRTRVSLMQITVPSEFHVPDQAELKRMIEERVGRIVGRFTHEGRQPLLYHYTAFNQAQLAAYYVAADAALVTPLRDGMNLIAKEYVACHADGDGLLILSEFAGAARELKEAILVNPYDPEAIARQLEVALAMPPGERRQRMRALALRVEAHDVYWWTSTFLRLLEE